MRAMATHDWTTALGWSLVTFVPDGVIIALFAAGLLWSIRGWTPTARYGVALGAMALMAAFPVISVTRQLAARVEPNPVAYRTDPAVAPVVAAWPGVTVRGPIAIAPATTTPALASASRIDWRADLEAKLPALVVLWLVGVLVLAVRLVVGLVEVVGLTRHRVEPLTGPTLLLLDRSG